MSLDLDDTDRAILRALQEDATLKASDLGGAWACRSRPPGGGSNA
jgi:DNA-binding Lrp family transcriptional regulator